MLSDFSFRSFWDSLNGESELKRSRGFCEEEPTSFLEIGLRGLLAWEDFSSYEDFWSIICKARSNFGELDRDSTQFCTCEERSTSSSATTTSYQDSIGFVKEMAKTKSFVGFWDFGDLDFVFRALLLSLDLDLGCIETYVRGIIWLGNQQWNLYLLLYILYQNKKNT